ncbi:type VII secretion integral membrane protein EccD [Rhodococcus sp. Z13]|uniref:Type VII secretion integral membrane protein EccD n=1 Tax=Rhodococcus sacchari TaxID=2962047 RepID=A0ACD4DD97_9NOCA|nr:type VII secretion integral membrane protein EccD [Rhodococcus sp. Z13]UYP17982.1 type VII secretion integral membrane protein EccD [Rhodococcus sp. Z13]
MTSVRVRSGPAGSVGAPALCRITVLARHTEVDLALPVDVPVALLLPGLVDLVAGHRRDNEFDATPERTRPDAWTLGRLGREPLSGALTLDEHGIRDGEMLVLGDAGSPAPPPLFDDVMYSVAASDRESVPWGSGPAGLIAAILAPLTVAVGCAPSLFLPDGITRIVTGVVCAALSLVLVPTSAILTRLHGDDRTATAVGLCSLPTAFTAGAVLVPGGIGAPGLLLGATLTGVVAVFALRVVRTGVTVFTALAAISAALALGSVLATTLDVGVRALGAGGVVAAVVLAGLAPRLAGVAARLPIPSVPAPGAPLDPETTGDGTAGSGATGSGTELPSLDELEARAARARAYLTGVLYAVVALATAGAWLAALPVDGDPFLPGIGLGVAAAAVLMFRGRTYTAAAQAAPLVAGGAVLLLGLLAGAAVFAVAPPWVVFGAAVTSACGAFLLGVVAPRRTFTPVHRRIAEIVEYACIAAVVPSACWVADLYSAVRGL